MKKQPQSCLSETIAPRLRMSQMKKQPLRMSQMKKQMKKQPQSLCLSPITTPPHHSGAFAAAATPRAADRPTAPHPRSHHAAPHPRSLRLRAARLRVNGHCTQTAHVSNE